MDIKMGMHQGLHLKQQIVMTQRLQQALKLLQVPTLELAQILRTELQANPLLEEIDSEDEAEDEDERDQQEARTEETSVTVEGNEEKIDWDEYFRDGFRNALVDQGSDEDDQLERPPVYVPSGQEHLGDQLVLAVDDPKQLEIGEYIIGCLNEDGFLAAPLAEIAAYFEIEESAVEEVLRIIQGFDPPGVAARDLPECLLLQLAARGQTDGPEVELK